jgi:hypothetical protein
MVKTQVQIPDRLYREAKRIAAERELSFAEVVRRGLEAMVQTYPPLEEKEGRAWEPPAPRALGWRGLSDDQLRDLANE